jgi:intracellular multiplication protein IcmE
MGIRTKNVANLFKDTRSRTILVITGILIVFALGAGYFIFKKQAATTSQASLESTPGGLQSIPGSFSQTEEYAKLQAQENLQKAQQAEKTGGSAIPTIIGATAPGEGQVNVQQPAGQPWQAGLGFQQLQQVQLESGPKALALNDVKNSKCAADQLKKALQQGASPAELRLAGCTAEQLAAAGFSAQVLQKAGYSACDLLTSNNVSPQSLKNAGYTAGELRGVGFNACQLKRAGYGPNDLAQAGFTADEMKGVGYTPEQIAAAGAIPAGAVTGGAPAAGISEAALKAAGCSPQAVKQALAQGVSAGMMRKIGCTAAQLKAGGYTATQLLNAGYSSDDLKAAGYSPNEIAAAEKSVQALGLPTGVTLASLAKAGCSPAAVSAARAKGVNAAVLKQLGCSAAELKAGGYSAKELKDAGFSAQDLKNAGFTASELRAAGFSPKELKDAGFSAADLKAAGFSPQQLAAAGFSPADIAAAGYSSQELAQAGLGPVPLQPGAQEAIAAAPVAQQPAGFNQTLAQQQNQIQQQQLQQQQTQMASTMSAQAGQLFAAWKPNAQSYVEAAELNKGKGANGEGPDGMSGAQGANGSNGVTLFSAGTILYAVLDTAVNSDEPGPVMATIIEGKYTGAKLLGQMTTFPPYGQKVMLSFNVMILPRNKKSLTVNAVAIDPNTARTALSTSTDNHYLMRFGSLFAASFLQGYGQALIQSGQTVMQTPISVTTSTPKLDPGEKVMVALGNVGTQFGSLLQQNFTRQPTVKVSSGTGIGILFMNDVQKQ